MANFYKPATKKHTKSEVLTVDINRLDLNGCGVASAKNKPIFIHEVLPDENVQVRIYEHKSKYSLAKLIQINKASPDRIEPNCSHFHICGGCDLQHMSLSAQLNFKQNKVSELFSREQISIEKFWQPAINSEPYAYRRKARIGVQFDKKNDAVVGFRRKGTNQLVSIKSCVVLDKSISSIFQPIKQLIAHLTVTNAIGHIEVIATEKTTLVVRQLKALNQSDNQLWQQYAEKHHWQVFIDDGKKMTLLSHADREENTDAKQSENKLIDALTNELTYKLSSKRFDDIHITFSPNDFIQVNHQVNLAMVEQAQDRLNLQTSDHVLDLFCGLGNFSLAIAKQVTTVVGIEGLQAMVDKAAINAKNNQLLNCQFHQADLNSNWDESVSAEAWTKQCFTKVLLDPARAGAEQAVVQIIRRAIPVVLYVSCDPTTLARDAKLLLSSGYKLEKIAIIDMFAQTKHVETMVLFTK